ncbi:MAG TPA: class I SAM-dependent methyltransferase [Acidimicrobiales bacterium]|nr:class I SAM-dependent methyltransferase [Acidimicrobiales bacterium]
MAERWVRFEDSHVLVVEKPAGVNTHRADTHAQEGMYEWVQRQRPGTSLSILHRLDKATSGVLLFGKTAEANRSLAVQFENGSVEKRYELLVRGGRRAPSLQCDRPIDGKPASTSFSRVAGGRVNQRYEAVPRTGRTHQVRVHAASLGMPVVGDGEHGGPAGPRLFLHAAHLGFAHPGGAAVSVTAERPASFDRAIDGAMTPALGALTAREARELLFDPADTDAWLWIDRHHDGFPGVRVERLGDVALAVTAGEEPVPDAWVDAWREVGGVTSVYEQRRVPGGGPPAALRSGPAAPRPVVTELGLRYQLDLGASTTSTGLFLDQRETRRRLLASDLAGRTVLNVFAHTGSLSVAAAAAGAETLSIDLGRRWLDWAADNMRLNDIDPADHDFVHGDAAEWMDRLARKGRTFDFVLVDPPSTSTTGTRGSKRFTVDRDLGALVGRAVRLCAPGGTVFVSTNLARMGWAKFLAHLGARDQGELETATVPLDHRTGPGDPPYLKAAWFTVDG